MTATAKNFKDLSVFQIDAHADLRNEYQANPASHACAMRRVVEVCPAVQVGIRSLSRRGSEGDSEFEDQHLLGEGYRARSHEALDRESPGRPESECLPHG